MRTATLYRVLCGCGRLSAHRSLGSISAGCRPWTLPAPAQVQVGDAAAGFGGGIAAAILGGAGGELYLPVLSVLFGLDVRLAGSLTLLVSLPTMLLAFARVQPVAGVRGVAPQTRGSWPRW